MIAPIPFSNGKYFASTDGYVISPSGVYPKKCDLFNNLNYPSICLPINGKMGVMPLHRVIALTFIPNPQNKKVVNHKDKNRQNATVDNLEWATQSENMKHIHSEYEERLSRIKVGDSVKIIHTGEIKKVVRKTEEGVHTDYCTVYTAKEVKAV